MSNDDNREVKEEIPTKNMFIWTMSNKLLYGNKYAIGSSCPVSWSTWAVFFDCCSYCLLLFNAHVNQLDFNIFEKPNWNYQVVLEWNNASAVLKNIVLAVPCLFNCFVRLFLAYWPVYVTWHMTRCFTLSEPTTRNTTLLLTTKTKYFGC